MLRIATSFIPSKVSKVICIRHSNPSASIAVSFEGIVRIVRKFVSKELSLFSIDFSRVIRSANVTLGGFRKWL
jgi:hypothetical protein